MKKSSVLITMLGVVCCFAPSPAAITYHPGEGWVYEEKEAKAFDTNSSGALDPSGTLVGRRPTVAVLSFENQTGDPAAAHWRFTLVELINGQLNEVKSLRLLSSSTEYAFRQLGLEPGAPVNAEQAREMGALLEARQVIWGNYRRQDGQWIVSARVMKVASGAISSELIAQAADWFDTRDRLVAQVLDKLGVAPTPFERKRMGERWTTSAPALEFLSEALALRETDQPMAEVVSACRKAIEADPDFAQARFQLSRALYAQGDIDAGLEQARQVVKLKPDLPRGHLALGWMLMQEQPEVAEAELQIVLRRDPDSSSAWHGLGELRDFQGKSAEAVSAWRESLRLDFTSAELHGHLALAAVAQQNRDEAMAELREAERFNPGNDATEYLLAQAYAELREIPAAIEHLEKFIAWAKPRGVRPEAVQQMERWLADLKQRLTPCFISAVPPKLYSESKLQSELHKRLTSEEARQVINPMAATPAMTNWAVELTAGAPDDMQKARKIFEALTRHLSREAGGTRTAREVFAAWKDPRESFSCQEYAKLFVPLARAVGVPAFYVHLEKDYKGRVVYHDCAVVFADGKALLMDPAYQWFGAPHQEFLILDDLQVVAHHYSQAADVSPRDQIARCRIANKLHPNFAWGQVALTSAYLEAYKLDEARSALRRIFELETNRWDAWRMQGVLGLAEARPNEAVVAFRKAAELNPGNGEIRLHLAHTLLKLGKSAEAQEEFKSAINAGLNAEHERNATRLLAELSEASDSPPQAADSRLQGQSLAPGGLTPPTDIFAKEVFFPATIVAVVNDQVILDSDVREKAWRQKQALQRTSSGQRTPPQRTQAQESAAIEDAIDDELILAAAVKAGRQVSEERLDRILEGFIQASYSSDSNAFAKALAVMGSSVEELRQKQRRRELMDSAVREKILDLAPPTTEQIEQYYRSHEKDFRIEEGVKLSMIVLNRNSTNNQETVESQRKLARELRTRLAEGDDFATVAQTYSQGALAKRGGDWGWAERKVLRKELADVAFSLKPGELSEVIETEQAWFILRVSEYRPGTVKPIAEVRDQITKTLESQQRSAAMTGWLDQLRQDVYPASWRRLRLQQCFVPETCRQD